MLQVLATLLARRQYTPRGLVQIEVGAYATKDNRCTTANGISARVPHKLGRLYRGTKPRGSGWGWGLHWKAIVRALPQSVR